MGLFDFLRGLFGTDADEDGRSSSPGGATGGENRTRTTEDGGEIPPGELVADDREELREDAEEFAGFWSEYELDFSPASIERLDELFASQQDRASVMQIEKEDGRTGQIAPIASSAACYFGETMLRNYDVEWAFDEDFGWALQFSDGTLINIFGSAHRGLQSGPPFVAGHDTFLDQFDLDGQPLSEESERVPVISVDDGVDPEAFDQKEIEAAAEEIGPEQLIAEFEDDAEEFASSWPDYDLDFSVDSLERLDQLVRAEFDQDAFADAQPGSTDDEASLLLTAHAMETGAYLGEVFRHTTDGSWAHTEEHGVAIELPGDAADAAVDPVGIAVDCLQGEATFADRYQDVADVMAALEDPGAGD